MPTRRSLLLHAGSTALWSLLPGVALARAGGERRLVVIVLRGALDGLHVVVPAADRDYQAARRELALAPDGDGRAQAPLRRLDDTFWLHGEMPWLAAAYARREAAFAHAVASPYRERSHFDAQNVLETGGLAAHQLRDGWLNRALAALPPPVEGRAIALSQALPPLLQGAAPATSYAPTRLPEVGDDTLSRVARLYADDPQLAGLWGQALHARGLVADASMAGAGGSRSGAPVETATLAARFLAQPDGPRVAVLEHGGWDTHAQQAPRLAALLRQLDRSLEALAAGLGDAWRDTAVLAISEFGRTVRTNGTGGTDHGTGGLAMLVGGAVRGGRVVADWPGLAPGALHEGRDLRPTTDLRAVIKGVLADHLGVERAALDSRVFPNSERVAALPGLV